MQTRMAELLGGVSFLIPLAPLCSPRRCTTAGTLGWQYFQVSTRTEGFGASVCLPATSCRVMQVKVKSVLQHTDVIHDCGLRVLSREGQCIRVYFEGIYAQQSLFAVYMIPRQNL